MNRLIFTSLLLAGCASPLKDVKVKNAGAKSSQCQKTRQIYSKLEIETKDSHTQSWATSYKSIKKLSELLDQDESKSSECLAFFSSDK